MKSNRALVRHVKDGLGGLFSYTQDESRVIQAMGEVDRADFLPPGARACAYRDEPVEIGWGQTCSQPSIVAFMLAELAIAPGNRVLEIGAGCGYAAAIASKLCAAEGKVYACERLPELVAQMRENLGSQYPNIEIVEADGSAGLPALAPFDRIVLSAGVDKERFKRDVLLAQLRSPGILIYPEAQGRLHKVTKQGDTLDVASYGYVSFVPLKGENA